MDTKLTNLKDNLEPLFEQFKEMIRVETVVGEPVQLGDTTIVPTAVLVIKGERIELFNIKGSAKYTGFDRLIGMVPEIISKLKKEEYVYVSEDK